MKYLIVFLLAVSAIACNNRSSRDEPRDGGGCTYKHDTIPATVVKIVHQYDDWHEVLFSVGKDTLRYSGEFSGYLRPAQIKEKGLELGAQFQYVISDIISGHCTPHITSLKLAKYTGAQKDVK